LYPAMRTCSTPGRLPERPMGADCKSVGLRLRRFESCTCHPGQRRFRRRRRSLDEPPCHGLSQLATNYAREAFELQFKALCFVSLMPTASITAAEAVKTVNLG
jgi:hypothetical protein